MVHSDESFSIDRIRVTSKLVNLFFEIISLISSISNSTELFSHIKRST